VRIRTKRLVAVLFFIIVTAGVAISFRNLPPHDFNFKEGECKTRCHIDFYPPLKFKASMIDMCDECHGDDEAVSHIVGVEPSMYVGDEFPLDENGLMTCNSCHNIHMERTNPKTGKRTYLLRTGTIGKDLCDKCHEGTLAPFMEGTPSHSETLVKAHFGYYSSTDSFVDQGSLQCMTCHEGSLADHMPVNFETGVLDGNHPIGIDYLRSFLKKNGGLKHPESINKEIKFIGGKLSCISCHNVYNLEKHKLTVSNEGSRLCAACHNM
jgi:hypothetical protein